MSLFLMSLLGGGGRGSKQIKPMSLYILFFLLMASLNYLNVYSFLYWLFYILFRLRHQWKIKILIGDCRIRDPTSMRELFRVKEINNNMLKGIFLRLQKHETDCSTSWLRLTCLIGCTQKICSMHTFTIWKNLIKDHTKNKETVNL